MQGPWGMGERPSRARSAVGVRAGLGVQTPCGEGCEGGHTRGCQRGEEGREREHMLTSGWW